MAGLREVRCFLSVMFRSLKNHNMFGAVSLRYFSTNLSNLSNDELFFHVKLGKPSAKIIQSKRRTSPLSDLSDLSDPSPGALERFFFFTNWQREISPKWRNEGAVFFGSQFGSLFFFFFLSD